jgi:regulatory protein
LNFPIFEVLKKDKPYVSISDALLKAASFCAYQERCHKEVLERLAEWGIYGEDADGLLVKLIELNYLNEERFAKAFAGGKFRVKQWGKLRIKQELKMRDISEYCIQLGLKEIEDSDYKQTLHEVLEKKLRSIKANKPAELKNKAYQYALSRGFEPSLIWECLAILVP